MNCIKESLLNYEATGLDYVHDRNVEIDDLFFKLGFSKEKSFTSGKIIKKAEPEEIETKKTEDLFEKGKGLLNKIGNFDLFKKKEVQEEKDPKETKMLKDRLYELLSEQCVLCGDYMVDSIQCSLSQIKLEKDKDGLKLNMPREPDFSF